MADRPVPPAGPGAKCLGGLPPLSGAEGEAAIAADTEAALREPQDNGSLSGSGQVADPEHQLATLIQLTGEAPSAVVWIGDTTLTEAALWRHLRTLNMVLIPKEYDAPDTLAAATGEDTHEAMMFRHGDGNVLAEVMPVLDAAQFSRVFGPARALMFMAPDHPASDGSLIRRAVLPQGAPPAQAGLLRLSMEEMMGIEAARLERSRLRIMTYLLKVAPDHTKHISETEFADKTALLMKEGRALGVRTEANLGRWCYLQVITNGEMGRQKSVTDFVTKRNLGNNPGASSDERVEILMWMASAQARRMEQ